MSPLRVAVLLSVVAGFSLVAGACAPGAPGRPTALVNPNGISDDISAVTMTESDRLRPADPNLISTYPKNFETRAP